MSILLWYEIWDLLDFHFVHQANWFSCLFNFSIFISLVPSELSVLWIVFPLNLILSFQVVIFEPIFILIFWFLKSASNSLIILSFATIQPEYVIFPFSIFSNVPKFSLALTSSFTSILKISSVVLKLYLYSAFHLFLFKWPLEVTIFTFQILFSTY